MWAKKESWKERWLIVPLLPSCQLAFCQQRIHERWKPSLPLAQIPLCTHKCRNSSKITKSKNFSRPHDPKSFQNKRRKEISFERGVAPTSAFVHQSLARKSLWWTVCACIFAYKCVHLHSCVCWRELRGGGSRESWLGIGVYASSAWAWWCRWKGVEVEVWVQVLESLSECLPAQLRDRCVPIMGECGKLNSPSHLSKKKKKRQRS